MKARNPRRQNAPPFVIYTQFGPLLRQNLLEDFHLRQQAAESKGRKTRAAKLSRLHAGNLAALRANPGANPALSVSLGLLPAH